MIGFSGSSRNEAMLIYMPLIPYYRTDRKLLRDSYLVGFTGKAWLLH
jgi:hypothetical protein